MYNSAMHHLIEQYRDTDGTLRLAIIYPCARAKYRLFDQLQRGLQIRWIELSGNISLFTEDEWLIVDALCNLLRYEPGFDLQPIALRSLPGLATELFLTQIDDLGNMRPSKVTELHQFEPVKRRTKTPEEMSANDLPFPTSGDIDCDTIANLVNGFQAFGLDLYQQLDAYTLDRVLYSLSELARDPDERIKEYLEQCLEEQKPLRDRLNKSLGLPTIFDNWDSES